MIVTTLAKEPLPPAIEKSPALASVTPAAAVAAADPAPTVAAGSLPAPVAGDGGLRLVQQKSVLPQLDVKLFFTAGSSQDPAGKEGLAALTAAMVADAGSRSMTIDQIEAVLYPMAGSFAGRADKEVTTFTGIIHRDHWSRFLSTVLPQLLDPGFRDDDFKRLKDAQLNALVQNLRSNNEEELGKERLQTNIFRGTAYGHVALGTVAGLNAITLDDVKQFAKTMYTRGESDGRDQRRRSGRNAADTPVVAGDPAGRPGSTPCGRAGHTAVRPRSGNHRERYPGDGALAGAADRSHAIAPGFCRAVGRASVARRTPDRIGPPVSAHPRGTRDELRRLRLHRSVPARACSSSSPTPTLSGSVRSSKSGSGRSFRSTRTWPCESRSTSSTG